jgi:rod shape determining protein RodA
MLAVGMVPPRAWMRLANPFYFGVLLLLVAVPLVGVQQLGARRWLGFGDLSLQPAELMKIALVAALARYYQWLPQDKISHPLWVALPLALIAAPAALVLKQPDLGTAILIVSAGLAVMFLAGVRPFYFAAGLIATVGFGNAIWPHLKDYQQRRLLTFLDPERDPLGAGYHIAQSKIALGSGGFHGRGFLGGTQSQLNFLPEKHTDFIFTMLAEEVGFIGGVTLMALYATLIAALFVIALRARTVFPRLLAGGVGAVFALHVSVNIGMVMGLVPVVGVPLPLVSYGGTSMLTLMFGLGLVLSAAAHRHDRNRRDEFGTFW